MPKVIKRDNEDLENLLKRFRRQVNDANILGECRKREAFISNGEKKKERKMKKLMAIRKQRAEQRREEKLDLIARNNFLNNRLNAQSSWNRNAPANAQPKVVQTSQKQDVKRPSFYSYRKQAPKQDKQQPKAE